MGGGEQGKKEEVQGGEEHVQAVGSWIDRLSISDSAAAAMSCSTGADEKIDRI